MDKINNILKSDSLKKYFMKYAIISMVMGTFLSLIVIMLCNYGRESLIFKYQEEYNRTFMEGNNLLSKEQNSGKGTLYISTFDIYSLMNKQEIMMYEVLNILSVFLVPCCYVLCIYIGGILFYKRKLKQPLHVLSNAADNIAKQNLDFEIDYKQADELGRLCLSFEKMRSSLQDNYHEIWRDMEDRKNLNAAFTHDLRTPLTVLKGQSEMLITYVPDQTMSREKIVLTAQTMHKHIIRLENYITTMSDLQRLNDINIHKTFMEYTNILQQLEQYGLMICKDREFHFISDIDTNNIIEIDFAIILLVYENILSNAIRYAHHEVQVSVQMDPFTIEIKDDGNGFDTLALKDATNPFYRSESGKKDHHMGMGLYICKVLCERHGGNITISNHAHGASVMAKFS